MRIDQFSAATHGGAAIAARRLHHSLRDAGIDSHFWCSKVPRELAADESYRELGSGTGRSRYWGKAVEAFRRSLFKRRWKPALRGRPAGFDQFNPAQAGCSTRLTLSEVPQILHLHWIAGWLDYTTFFGSVPAETPIAWTLHDMHPLTGGCHYSSGCEAFVTGCGNCPQLGRPSGNDLSRRSWAIKRDALQHQNLHIVTPSRWLEAIARRSPVLQSARSFRTIANGLDTEAFAPMPKRQARHELGLATDRVVIGFGAEQLSNTRKGFQHLLDALSCLPDRDKVVGLVFGSGKIPDQPGLPRIDSVGFLDSIAAQRRVYSAQDMFVMPSLEDNLPQTGVEAMACGTPVVAFDTGGVPDYVHHERTGLLAQVGDAHDLARQIARLTDSHSLRTTLGANGRKLIEKRCHMETQRQAYVDFYRELVETGAERKPVRRVA